VIAVGAVVVVCVGAIEPKTGKDEETSSDEGEGKDARR
jgi:hypothetical protein